MKAVLLAGGLGTRLREETEFRPKPMVQIGGRPVIWHIMKTYAAYGITDFVICTGYKGEVIRDYFLNYETNNNDFTIELGARHEIQIHGRHDESNWRVTVADTGQDTLTGGRVKAIEKYIDEDTFMVSYGDGVCDINVDQLLEFHRSHGKAATVTTVKTPSRFGLLQTDSSGAVSHFVEKPQLDGWVNAGFFVFKREVFNYLKPGQCVLEGAPLAELTKDGQLYAYHHAGFWQPMDTHRETMLLNKMWDAGEAPWKVW